VSIHQNVTCPQCWKIFDAEDILWVSVSPKLKGDSRLPEGQLRFLPSRYDLECNAIDPEDLVCHELACPRCHLPVPRALLEMKPFFVSIVGSPGSGKTYLLASMTHRLREIMPEIFGLSFTDSQPDANQRLIAYEEQQFTNSDQDSLIKLLKTAEYGDDYYSVSFPGNQRVNFPKPFFFSIRSTAVADEHSSQDDVFRPISLEPSQGGMVPHVLCLYDNAGESFMPGTDITEHPVSRHVAEAQAIIFLFDPTQVEKIRTALQGKTNDPQVTEGRVTFKHEIVLHELAQRVRRHATLGENDRHQCPLIVAVTKYDAWWKLANLEELPVVWKKGENGNPGEVNMNIINQASNVIRNMLLRFSQEFVHAAENFCEEVYYLPVSATGSAPESNPNEADQFSHRPKNIHPMWVEVPMLLALSKYCDNLIK
jgi:hypothetical protein